MRFVERDIEIFKAVVGGKTLRQVAEAHGVSAGRIQQIVDRMRRCATGSFNRNEPRSHDVGPPDFHEDRISGSSGLTVGCQSTKPAKCVDAPKRFDGTEAYRSVSPVTNPTSALPGTRPWQSGDRRPQNVAERTVLLRFLHQ